MTIDPYKDYTLEEQQALDLRELFAGGLRQADGSLRAELQGVGAAAAAIQARAIPLPMIGLMLTNANEKTLLGAQRHPEDLCEELDKRGHGWFADVIRAGIAACQTDDDYLALVRWLGMVRNLMVVRASGK